MKKIQPVKGFSKLSKQAKIEWLINNYSLQPDKALDTIQGYLHQDVSVQKLHDEFIENTISNFYLPFGIAPNFLINGHPENCVLLRKRYMRGF